MEASVDSGRGSVSLLCCEKLDSCCRAHPDRKLLVDDRVLNNLLQHEDVYRPSMDYFVVQEDIKPYMRKIVSDWMLEVCEEQECPEDLFALAVNLMDRFLCTTSIQKTQFQLLGTTCLYIASKLKMPRPLSAQDLVIYTDQSITLEELKSWELLVLAKLQWDVNAVTGHDFLDYMIHRLSLLVDSEQVRTHAQVFVSLCATDHNFARLPASLIAASSIGAAAHGLYYRSMSGSSAASTDTVETNNNHSSKAARRRRSCHEEDADEEPMDYDDEDIENNPRVAASMSHAPVSLNDSGTSSIHDHDYDDHGLRQSTHRSARNHHASLPSPQRFLEDLLRQLANITCIEMTVLRECVDQIEKLVRLRLSTENEGSSSQPKGCGAEAAAAAGGEFTEVGY